MCGLKVADIYWRTITLPSKAGQKGYPHSFLWPSIYNLVFGLCSIALMQSTDPARAATSVCGHALLVRQTCSNSRGP